MAKSNKKSLVIALLIIGAIAGGVLVYKNTNKPTEPSPEDTAKTTSSEPSAQEDFNVSSIDPNDTAKDREPGNSIREDEGSAGISDTGGTTKPANTSNPVVSSTGEITVYSPQPNQTASSKITVAGASSLKTITYRISDDLSGVLVTGYLNVVGGKFSGDLKITTGAKTGQISFFGTESNGNEFSNVTIPLKF